MVREGTGSISSVDFFVEYNCITDGHMVTDIEFYYLPCTMRTTNLLFVVIENIVFNS